MGVKELPRLTVCTLFKIRQPEWQGGKEKMVGLNLNRLRDKNSGALVNRHNEVVFTYRRKSDGQLSFPDPYYFDGEKLNQIDFEVQMRKGTPLVKIPFSELEVLRRV